jgi:Flp pilus assembly protein TadG
VVIAQKLPHASRRQRIGHLDRGAAAVEMALVSPLLIAMIIGIIDFSRIFNAEIQLSQAAREGARLASLGFAYSDVQTRAVLAAPHPAFGGPLLAGNVTQSGPACTTSSPSDAVATVQVTYTFQGIFWMNGSTLTQTAVMRCAG